MNTKIIAAILLIAAAGLVVMQYQKNIPKKPVCGKTPGYYCDENGNPIRNGTYNKNPVCGKTPGYYCDENGNPIRNGTNSQNTGEDGGKDRDGLEDAILRTGLYW